MDDFWQASLANRRGSHIFFADGFQYRTNLKTRKSDYLIRLLTDELQPLSRPLKKKPSKFCPSSLYPPFPMHCQVSAAKRWRNTATYQVNASKWGKSKGTDLPCCAMFQHRRWHGEGNLSCSIVLLNHISIRSQILWIAVLNFLFKPHFSFILVKRDWFRFTDYW